MPVDGVVESPKDVWDPISAQANCLALCHQCELLIRLPPAAASEDANCPRCMSAIHVRKPDSFLRTLLLLSAAYLLLIPANLLPIMATQGLGGVQRDTIMSGVIYLWQAGAWPLSLIVFIASVVVPFTKLGILTFLLYSVRSPSRWSARERTRLYRFIEVIGRWSMLDIFVVTLLAALVRMEALATVDVGAGAIAFGAVVVLTMLATHAFDPRMIWDNSATK
jgi:paraquat-inducible protein A